MVIGNRRTASLTTAGQPDTYRSVYRMNRECFDHLLNELSNHPEFQQTGPDDVPAVVQIATCLFRMSYCHHRFTQAYTMMNNEAGADYITFTKRTMRAIKDKLGHLVSWPDVPPKAADDTEPAKCVGVIAEKNISFHYPSSPRKRRYDA